MWVRLVSYFGEFWKIKQMIHWFTVTLIETIQFSKYILHMLLISMSLCSQLTRLSSQMLWPLNELSSQELLDRPTL